MYIIVEQVPAVDAEPMESFSIHGCVIAEPNPCDEIGDILGRRCHRRP